MPKMIVVVLLLATSGTSFSQSSSPRVDKDGFKVLADLIETYGVSGHEQPVRDKVKAYLPGWAKPEIDGKGNLLVTFGSGDEHIIFVGHLDEVGYIVKDFHDDGTLGVEDRKSVV